jgi:hypothetical protein
MPGVDQLAADLAAISARLREAGEGGLARRLSAGIGKAVEPLEREVRDGLRSRMPDRYAEVIGAELSVTRRTFTDPDGARVTVYARTTGEGKRKIGRLDDGILWHPTFGRFPRGDPRNTWSEMREPHVRPGWWSDATEAAAPRARQEIEDALNDVTERIVRR